ncbi:MAG: SPOR domain-containing protein [Deltaproteobacteria bacterium]|nr:SPOR domain-containing protein [Deltaproteobacteria bacterium]
MQNRRPARWRQVSITVLISLWMFILGVLVGRGTSPVKFDMESIQEQMSRLKTDAVQETKRRYKIKFKEMDQRGELDFPEDLKKPSTDLQAPSDRLLVEKLNGSRSSVEPNAASSVTNRATQPNVPRKTQAAIFKKNGRQPALLTIQVAATQNADYANQVVSRLVRKGFQAYRTSGQSRASGTWYRIRVGRFSNRAEAHAIMEKLKAERFSPIVIKR